MTNKLTGRLTAVLNREPRQLVAGAVLKVQPIIDGVYVSGSFQGEANGWYNDNLPGLVPVGLWDSLGNRTDANGLYENNIKITMDDGLWVAEVYQGPVHGWYQHNAPAVMDPGLWVDNTYQGIVNGWYVSNVRMTLSNGLWVDEEYQGAVSGWYVDNAPALMATGLWENNAFVGPVNGYYVDNEPEPVPDAVWDGGVDTGLAQGWYEANKPAPVPSGIWNGGNNEGLATGIYRQNIIQTRQLQDVLESLRVQHNPQHWASWALDGSLEEDRGQFPLIQSFGYKWVNVGPRKAPDMLGDATSGLVYGTNQDFRWVTEGRVVTMGAWVKNPFPGSNSILTTAGGLGTSQTGFNLFQATNVAYLDYKNSDNFQRFSNKNTGIANTPVFVVWQMDGIQSIPYMDGRERARQAITGTPRIGPTFSPFSIGWRSPVTIWNAFITNQLLTEQEIYRLYVAGLNDIQTF